MMVKQKNNNVTSNKIIDSVFNQDMVSKFILLVNLFNSSCGQLDLFTASMLNKLDLKTFKGYSFNKSTVSNHKKKYLSNLDGNIELGNFIGNLSLFELPFNNIDGTEIFLEKNFQLYIDIITTYRIKVQSLLDKINSKIIFITHVDYNGIFNEYKLAQDKTNEYKLAQDKVKESVNKKNWSLKMFEEVLYDSHSPVNDFKKVLERYENYLNLLCESNTSDELKNNYDNIRADSLINPFPYIFNDEIVTEYIKKFIDLPSTKIVNSILTLDTRQFITNRGYFITPEYVNKLKKDIKIDEIYFIPQTTIDNNINDEKEIVPSTSIDFNNRPEQVLEASNSMFSIQTPNLPIEIPVKVILNSNSTVNIYHVDDDNLKDTYYKVIEFICKELNDPNPVYVEYRYVKKLMAEYWNSDSVMSELRDTMNLDDSAFNHYNDLRKLNQGILIELETYGLNYKSILLDIDKYDVAKHNYNFWQKLHFSIVGESIPYSIDLEDNIINNYKSISFEFIDQLKFIENVCDTLIAMYFNKHSIDLKKLYDLCINFKNFYEKAKNVEAIQNKQSEINRQEELLVISDHESSISSPQVIYNNDEKLERHDLPLIESDANSVIMNMSYQGSIYDISTSNTIYSIVEKDEINQLIKVAFDSRIKNFTLLLINKIYYRVLNHTGNELYDLSVEYENIASPQFLKGYVVTSIYKIISQSYTLNPVLSGFYNNKVDAKLDYLENKGYLGFVYKQLDRCFDLILDRLTTTDSLKKLFTDISMYQEKTNYKFGKDKYYYTINGFSDLVVNENFKNKKEY